MAAQALWPLPNIGVANQVSNNYQTFAPSVNPFLKFFGRLDYNISDSNRLTFSITERDNTGIGYSVNCPSNCNPFDIDSRNIQLSDVWTITPRIVNEFRMAYTRQGNWYTPMSFGQGYPAKLNMPYAIQDVLPTLTVSGPVGGTSIGPGTNAIYAEDSLQPSDVVTLIKGKHILHFGGELLDFRDNSTPWGNINAASLTFSGAFTRSAYNVTTTGLGYADFLLGAVSSWSAGYTPLTGARQMNPQTFIQDDFKVLPNLTVNLGLRYERQAGWHEVANRIGTFDPTLTNPLTNTPGAMWIAPANGRTNLMEGVNVWLPRASFAWSPASKWSIRGGGGIYSLPWSIDTYSAGALGFGTKSSGSISNTDQTTPLFYAQNPAPPITVQNGCVPGTGCLVLASHDPGGYNGQGVSFMPRHIPVGKNYQWSFSVQREIGSMVVEAAYVANHGTGLPYPIDINQIPVASLGLLPVQNYRAFPQYTSHQRQLLRRVLELQLAADFVPEALRARVQLRYQLRLVEDVVQLRFFGLGQPQRHQHHSKLVRPQQFLRAFQLRHSARLEGLGRLRPAVRQGQAVPQPRRHSGCDCRRVAGLLAVPLPVRQHVHCADELQQLQFASQLPAPQCGARSASVSRQPDGRPVVQPGRLRRARPVQIRQRGQKHPAWTEVFRRGLLGQPRPCTFRNWSAVSFNSGLMRPTLSTTPASAFRTPALAARLSGRSPVRRFPAAPCSSAPVSRSDRATVSRRTAAPARPSFR